MKNLVGWFVLTILLTSTAQARLKGTVHFSNSTLRIGFGCDSVKSPFVKWISAQPELPVPRSFEIPIRSDDRVVIENLNVILVSGERKAVIAQVTQADLELVAKDCVREVTPQIPAAFIPENVRFQIDYDVIQKVCSSWTRVQLGLKRGCEYTDRLFIRTGTETVQRILQHKNVEDVGFFWPTGG